ncbi:aminoacyl-tRNA hydrolase [Belliella sp. DSM 111904]|uniref:Aminoacyl-tRNA hydrolase n=1 Tax=Belliella filtrata TaxID=2923435 RepID=A0ABS9V5Z7_9BACT|nr:aminoacyl-tRNA hydrolase [Belliella filtrata]
MSIGQKIKSQVFNSEFEFQTSRSSGPGGQNVNKVNSKVQLFFNIQETHFLNEEEKQNLYIKWANKIDNEGKIMFQSQEKRSQTQNKEQVIKRFYDALSKAFEKKKVRKATKPKKSAIEARIKAKKSKGEKKQSRGKVDW